MADSLSLSLDALIAQQAKPARNTHRNTKPRSSNAPYQRHNSNNNSIPHWRPTRNNTHQSAYMGHDDRTAINYNVPATANVTTYSGGNVASRPVNAAASIQSRKLMVSNLHQQVTEKDVKDLFQEIGNLEKWTLLFDSTGRSTGCAEVIFRSASDALQAFNEYNGVQLDGRTMVIEVVAPLNVQPATPIVQRVTRVDSYPAVNRPFTRPYSKSSGRGRGRGRERGGVDRKSSEKNGGAPVRGSKTAEDLDKEMNSYFDTKGAGDIDGDVGMD